MGAKKASKKSSKKGAKKSSKHAAKGKKSSPKHAAKAAKGKVAKAHTKGKTVTAALNHYAASNGKWTIGGLNKPDVFSLITHNGM
eukprot:gene19937-10968_t